MKDKTEKEILDIINSVEDAEDSKLKQIMRKDPVDAFKLRIMEFFETQLKYIDEEVTFKKTVREEIINRLVDFSNDQLIKIYKTVFNETTLNIESLLAPFKPTQSGSSPLLDKAKEDSRNVSNDAFSDMDQEQIKATEKFIRIMEAINDSVEKEK